MRKERPRTRRPGTTTTQAQREANNSQQAAASSSSSSNNPQTTQSVLSNPNVGSIFRVDTSISKAEAEVQKALEAEFAWQKTQNFEAEEAEKKAKLESLRQGAPRPIAKGKGKEKAQEEDTDMAFNFGQSSSGAGTFGGGNPTQGGGFGNNNNNTPATSGAGNSNPFAPSASTGGSLFGGSGANQPTTGGFGSAPPNNAPSIFSQPQKSSEQSKPSGGFSFTPQPASPAPGSSVFAPGSNPAPTLFGGLGGQTASPAGTPSEQSKPASGGMLGQTPATTRSVFDNPSTQPTASGQGGSVFGGGFFGASNTTPQTNKTFQASTTPAGAPPNPNPFGVGSILSNENKQPSFGQAPGKSSFGNSAVGASAAPTSQFPGTAPPQASGSQPPNSAGFFAPKTGPSGQAGPSNDSSSGASSLFSGLGQNKGPTPGASSGAPTTTSNTSGGTSMFGGTNFGGRGGGTAASSGTNQSGATTTAAGPTLPSFTLGGQGGSSGTNQPPTTTSAFSGFSLGGQGGSSGTSQPTTTAPAAPSGLGGASSLFGTPAGGAGGSAAPLGGTSNTSSAPPASGTSGQGATSTATTTAGPGVRFDLGTLGGSTSTSGQGATATTSSTTGGLSGTAPGTGAGSTTQPPASTSGPTPPQQSRLAAKSMDEILTMWSTSLATHQKTFQQLATRVSAWDRLLVANSSKISTLYSRCFQAERDCSEVERQLGSVEQEQMELEQLLERYESEVDRVMEQVGVGDGGAGVSGVDAERERTYKAAESCSSRLTEMHHSLTDMIDEVNAASGQLTSSSSTTNQSRQDDPLAEIVRVLNGHLAQLQVIDGGAAALQAKVGTAQREARSLGQGMEMGGGGLGGREEFVRGFGESYLGRGR